MEAAGVSRQGRVVAPEGVKGSERAGRRGEDFLGVERCGRLGEKGG